MSACYKTFTVQIPSHVRPYLDNDNTSDHEIFLKKKYPSTIEGDNEILYFSFYDN